MVRFPKVFRLRQHFEAPRVEDVAAEVHAQLQRLDLRSAGRIAAGDSVAITAGSRGVTDIALILKAAVEHFRSLGAEPFLVPAMGSHGGGTAEGQGDVLARYGITESQVGCPIRSQMDTVVVCRTPQGFPVHFDRLAYEADHVLVVNRVKPHTRFVGPIESGLLKMMLIGLGKREGATIYHRAIQDYSFDEILRGVVAEVLARCPVRAGLAVVENAFDQTARIEAVLPADFETRERELLELARRWMARLPFERADVLVVDRIGKDVSGTGMDTNVIGRKFDDHRARDDEFPKIRSIAVRGLTPQTHGNAVGLGMAEFCRTQILHQTDFEATRLNALTAGHPTAAMLPLDYPTDRRMLEAAMIPIGLVEPEDARLLWIADTLALAELECSTAYLEEAGRRDGLEILSDPRELPFNAAGNLPEVEQLAARGGTENSPRSHGEHGE
jgi:hypothetical protein